MSKIELTDLVKYFHNVRNEKGELVPIIGEDKLAVTAALAYLLEDQNFLINAYSGTGKTVIMNAVFKDNLLKEGHKKTNIFFVGNLMIDSLFYGLEKIKNKPRFQKEKYCC